MLKIIDLGCHNHDRRQLTFLPPEDELMKDIIFNLPRSGDFHTYICDHGHTHHVAFETRALNVASF